MCIYALLCYAMPSNAMHRIAACEPGAEACASLGRHIEAYDTYAGRGS